VPTVESESEVGWARSGQAAAETAEAKALLREAEAAFGRDDPLTAADILHDVRETGLPCGERADRLVERIRSSLRDADRAGFEHTLRTGLPEKPESEADAGVSRTAGERRPVGTGPWTLSVLAGWLAVSATFTVIGAGDDSIVPWGTWFLVLLGVFSVPALVVWLVGSAFMRRAQSGHDNGRASDQSQTLPDELTGARALIEQGEYAAALDALTSASEAAHVRHDVVGLNEVRLLAERVSERALERNDRGRADALRHAVADERDAAATSELRLRATSGSMKYFAWSLLVWVPVTVLASVSIATDPCPPAGCFGPSGTDIGLALVFLLGLPVYLIGLLVIWTWNRAGRPPQP
jgi:hypothetical protein